MEDRDKSRMRKYGESKTTQIMIATVRHVTCSSGLRKFQTDGFLLDGVYMVCHVCKKEKCSNYADSMLPP